MQVRLHCRVVATKQGKAVVVDASDYIKLTDKEKIEIHSRRVLEKYKPAFKELAEEY